jgi:FAD/FMN-containing dehydrogenase/Fe-S oxidoreductase
MVAIDLDRPMRVREQRQPYVRVRDLERDLRAVVQGDVRFDAVARGAYSTDGSNYRQVPLGVVLPRTPEDAVAAVDVCRRHGAPLTSRGGGTSLAGQACNVAVILDWSKYCHRLVSVDVDRKTCVVEPGIVLDVLNEQLAEQRLMFGPRPATHDHCTLGGMIGNNSCGSTAQAYGKTVDNVVRLEVLTYDGTRTWVGATSDAELDRLTAEPGGRGALYRGMRALRDEYGDEVRARYPHIPRRVSGYNLDSLLPEKGFQVAQALVGSEGTLVTVLRAELQLVDVPAATALVVLGYGDIATAADAVPHVLPHRPAQLEGIDDRLVSFEREKREHREAIAQLPRGAGWLMVSLTGDSQDEADARARALLDDLAGTEREPTVALFDTETVERQLWEVREGGLGATARAPGMRDTWEGWEDSAVPPERLGDYLRDLGSLFERFGYGGAALYGHFGQGCVHTRIPFDLVSAAGVASFRSFVEQAADLVVSYGGSLSGEHGDGQSRAELLPRMFGDDVVEAFGRLKGLFDPDDRMNPGKVVHPNRLDEQLRLGPQWSPSSPATVFGYPEDDGRFQRAVMRCVGVGKCRHEHGGVMCPSYMVTRDEEHSTRGRARLLFEMLEGHDDSPVTGGWRSTAVREALDLCLACKGCKKDCPVGVDMATYKAEFLHHHYRGRLRPLAHYSMGWLPVAAQVAALAPQTVNRVTSGRFAGMVKRLGGIDPRRTVPAFAPWTLQRWASHRSRGGPGSRGEVLLWPDTFTNHFAPRIGVAATHVLEDAGWDVVVPPQALCCGLTWISTGQLHVARRVLRRTLDVLAPYLQRGTPVLGLEPSCTAVFRSDGVELLAGDKDAARLQAQTVTLAELLRHRTPGWEPPRLSGKAVVQTHCHQHAVLGFDDDAALLRATGLDVDVLDSGCCGLAGNFGFERGHYDVSRAAGERVLLPAVRAASADTWVLADGFSCRTQVEQGDTGRTPAHLAEVLASARSAGAPS